MPPTSVDDKLADWENSLDASQYDTSMSAWEHELELADNGTPGTTSSKGEDELPEFAASPAAKRRHRDREDLMGDGPLQASSTTRDDDEEIDPVRAAMYGLQDGELDPELSAKSNTQRILLGISALLEFMIGDADSAAAEQPREEQSSNPLAVFTCEVGAAATLHNINNFLVDMARVCQYTLECNVIALILLIRILSYHPYLKPETRTWRRYLLCALMIAQKFWDDRCLRNIDFTIAWKCVVPTAGAIDLRDVNLMERHFLAGLGYDLYIQPKKYSACLLEVLSIVINDKSSEKAVPTAADVTMAASAGNADNDPIDNAELHSRICSLS